MIPKLLLLLVLIVVNAFFAMSEIAIISLNDTKIKHLAEEGDKKAKQIVKLTENSSRFLSTIQIGVTLAGFLTSASASASFAGIITKAVVGRWPGLSAGLISAVSVVVITIITSYFSLVLGELAPKKIAMQAPEKVSYKVVGILLFFSKLVKPFVKFLALSTNGVVRLFGFDPNADEENVTEEEIRLMVDAGEEKGVIENTQAEMIDNIFEFDDLDAGDIMTHRTDMVAIEATRALDEVADLCVENGYSRLPVYKDDQDNIIGVIYAKDLLKYVGRNIPSKLTIEKIMRKPLYVAETQACSDIFKAMNESRTQFAVVVDEYGGTAGIVTLEDVIESIVGNIRDEYDDDEEEEIVQINETTFTIDGTTNIDEVNSRAGVKLPEGDYDTLAGFIIDRLGYLPDENTELPLTIEYENIRFTVLSMDERRLEEIKVEILPPEDEDPEE
ncbi:MAG: HlyC/CorC family transporter [Clostridia bacterium]|nr:HlyC/CorC family transporter [Clostridia bacterium]MBQ6468151.1 HlyC/CorC family transporter [Clostridia bacterium]MBR6335341.1 HlyC/CorC family transporter [Clostridia bacterium]